jgi:membrane-associated protease RseP (regulator of RpoE activity)
MQAFWQALATVVQIDWWQGLLYMGLVMGLLLTHEMGHFLMAVRHRIPASLPYFIPLPIIPFGTMGAVIGMEGSRADRRQMFDLGVAGPLAGLAVTLPIMWIGILLLPSEPLPGDSLCFHNPLIFQWLFAWVRPDYPTPAVLYLNQFNPFLMAGWVGVLVTGLNMLPVGQLDGGHVAYALLGQRAHSLARGLLVAAIVFVLATETYFWVIMLILVILLGTDHPPTADDSRKLGWIRKLIGWGALLIPILCFPPLGIAPIIR